MKNIFIFFLSGLILISCESEPDRDPILNKVASLPHFNAESIPQQILDDPLFEKKYQNQLVVVKGKIHRIDYKKDGTLAVQFYPMTTPIHCDMKNEQKYYRKDYKGEMTATVVGKAEVFRYTTERGEKLAFLTLRQGVFVR